MEHSEFARLAPILRPKAKAVGREFFGTEESKLAEAIRRAAGTLRRSEGRLWRTFAEAGMTTSEIASATGINIRTVSSMLSHARRHIYNVLTEVSEVLNIL